MKRLTTPFFIAAVAITSLLVTSCGSNEIYTQNVEGSKALKKEIATAFDENKPIEEISITAKKELYGEFGNATITYWDGETQMNHVFTADKGLQEPKETFASQQKKTVPSFPLTKGAVFTLKQIDIEQIPGHVGAAVALIPAGYDQFSLYRYSFSAEKNGQVKQDFQINATKTGESSKQSGRMITTNFYEFNFSVDENGKVKAVE
jgi:predicted small secreted protein